MHITAFLQTRNNVDNGYLERCLTSMSLVADEICLYDDASDQDVWPIYKRFNCTVVRGHRQAFHRELYHKAQLLQTAVRYRPDWIVWFDTDAVLGKLWEDRNVANQILESAAGQGFVRLFLHNANLWRSNWWHRTDCSFYALWHCVFFKNTGELHYRPVPMLHQAQFPRAWRDERKNALVDNAQTQFDEVHGQLLHFGFSTEEEIARKWYTYRAQGQTGGRLDRLVTETGMVNPYTGKHEDFKLERVEEDWIPEWLRPQLGEPTEAPTPTLTPELFAKYADFNEWKASRDGVNRSICVPG